MDLNKELERNNLDLSQVGQQQHQLLQQQHHSVAEVGHEQARPNKFTELLYLLQLYLHLTLHLTHVQFEVQWN